MTADTGASSNELRRNSLGLIAVTFMVISAAAPLTGVAGAVPIAFLIGNGTGVPATFIAMTLIMLAFSVGYVAMSRHVRNAGAFYAYAARGLGGYAGGATAFGKVLGASSSTSTTFPARSSITRILLAFAPALLNAARRVSKPFAHRAAVSPTRAPMRMRRPSSAMRRSVIVGRS